ncbi:MAG: hypothetical protein RBR77_03765, partial [Thauera sp.]|nr:hypothetical protein [Thauera sp.]
PAATRYCLPPVFITAYMVLLQLRVLQRIEHYTFFRQAVNLFLPTHSFPGRHTSVSSFREQGLAVPVGIFVPDCYFLET